jgi:hypothetical protein
MQGIYALPLELLHLHGLDMGPFIFFFFEVATRGDANECHIFRSSLVSAKFQAVSLLASQFLSLWQTYLFGGGFSPSSLVSPANFLSVTCITLINHHIDDAI